MIPKDVTMFTWLDVEEVLLRLIEEERWPESLLRARAYWDCLSLWIMPESKDEILNWLSVEFEPRFDKERMEIILEGSDDDPRSLPVSLERIDIMPSSARFIPSFSRPMVIGRNIIDKHNIKDEVIQPPVLAFHSFKGGVGRTIHALALVSRQTCNVG